MTYQSFPQGAGLDRPSAGLLRARKGANSPQGSVALESAGDDPGGDKLKALVQLDVEGSTARIKIKGAVDARNVKAVYILAKRANSIAPGADIVLDLQRATVQSKVMEKLRKCARERRLPLHVDPKQSECRLRITPAAKLAFTSVGLTLAA
jgi:hypothetical protein